jgi:hypothetical protein
MSRNTRSTRRRASQSPDRLDDIFDLTRSADDVHNELMQQALLEAIGGVPTPVSPTYHKFSPTSPTYSRRSHRSSIVPAAYDPARPNAESHDVPYDPAAWADATVISSDHGSRRSRASTPLFGRSAAHYSPSIPVFSPNSRPLRTSQEYDPLAPTPGYRYADRLPGRASWRQAPYVSDNELSPGYQPYEGHERAGNYRRTSARLERLARTLDRFATHVDSRMDRMEAQLGALYDALSEQADGPRGAGSASSGGRKRKRLSSTSSSPSKRVSFDTPDSDTSFEPSISDLFPSEEDYDDDDSASNNDGDDSDDDGDEDGDEDGSPPQKPRRSPTPSSKRSPSPKTPPNRGSPSPPRTPRKPAPTRLTPRTPPQQTGPDVSSTPAASRKSRTALKSPAAQVQRPPPQQITRAVPAAPISPRKKRSGTRETAPAPPPAPALLRMRSSARIRAQAAGTKSRPASVKAKLEGSPHVVNRGRCWPL